MSDWLKKVFEENNKPKCACVENDDRTYDPTFKPHAPTSYYYLSSLKRHASPLISEIK